MALIVDLDMPSCCGSCRASGTDVCKSWFSFLKHLGEGRPIGCPIKGEIPDEHGRLIDEADLRKRAYELQRRDGCTFPEALALALTSAPTIVEATNV